MRVGLNVTQAQLRAVSGDLSYYRDLVRGDGSGLVSYEYVNQYRPVRRTLQRLAEYGSWRLPLAPVAGAMLRYGRSTFISKEMSAGWDVILTHIAMVHGPGVEGKPVIWSTQGLAPAQYYEDFGPCPRGEIVKLYESYARRADIVLVWTESGAEELVKSVKVDARVVVLPPVVPRSGGGHLMKHVPGEDLRVLFVGRDAERKGLADVMMAFEQLRRSGLKISLDVVSKLGQNRDQVAAVQGCTYHESPSDEHVSRLMDESHVLALPTKAETYGYVLVEAMAHGCAIITTNAPPMNELVIDGYNGKLVRPSSSADIVAALETIAVEQRVADMQEASLRLYERHYAPHVAAPRYHQLFSEAIKGNGAELRQR